MAFYVSESKTEIVFNSFLKINKYRCAVVTERGLIIGLPSPNCNKGLFGAKYSHYGDFSDVKTSQISS